MKVDRERSEVELDGRRFPACALICPPTEAEFVEDEWDFSLGIHAHDRVYIPLENGILVGVGPRDNSDLLDADLSAWQCGLSHFPDEPPIYLPLRVGLRDGELVVDPHVRDKWDWSSAEEWWVAEFIDRVSRMSFTPPEGPKVQAVPLNRFEERSPKG